MVPSPIKAQAGSVPASDPSCPAAWFRRSRKRSRAARSTNREAHRLAEGERQELEGLLEGRAAGLFSRYLDHQAQADLDERLALFQCGLSLGQELSKI